MIPTESARVLSEEEQQQLEREWARSDERKRLCELRERIEEKRLTLKACHSY
jgi:hypothetical protein